MGKDYIPQKVLLLTAARVTCRPAGRQTDSFAKDQSMNIAL